MPPLARILRMVKAFRGFWTHRIDKSRSETDNASAQPSEDWSDRNLAKAAQFQALVVVVCFFFQISVIAFLVVILHQR